MRLQVTCISCSYKLLVVMRCGKEISKEEDVCSLMPSSSVFSCILREELCGRRRRANSLQFFFFHVEAIFHGRLCGCRRQSVSGDINALKAGSVGGFEQVNLNSQRTLFVCGCVGVGANCS